MRYLRIFSLYFQDVLESRSRLLVWFLIVAINPIILLLFWRGAKSTVNWTSAEITSYYLLAIVIVSFFLSHHEDRVALIDIKEGGLTAYLLKPFSYFWIVFFAEVPYRIVQGSLSLLLLIIICSFSPKLFVFTHSLEIFLLSLIIAIGAFFIGFFLKMVVGMFAFWMIETKGAFEAVEVLLVIFSGMLMPLAFMPGWLIQIAYLLPFSYMIYFPVIAFEGKLLPQQLLQIIVIQVVWIILFYFLYRLLWKEGVKKYTAIGQ